MRTTGGGITNPTQTRIQRSATSAPRAVTKSTHLRLRSASLVMDVVEREQRRARVDGRCRGGGTATATARYNGARAHAAQLVQQP